MEQLRIKSEQEQAVKEEEDMYAKLWYADMETKAQREEEETKKQMQANRDTLEVLQRQMAALEAQKQQEKYLVEEEARILVSFSVNIGQFLCEYWSVSLWILVSFSEEYWSVSLKNIGQFLCEYSCIGQFLCE